MELNHIPYVTTMMDEEPRYLLEALSEALRGAGDAIITIDVGGHIQRMSPLAEKLTGWALSEIRGAHLGRLFHFSAEQAKLCQHHRGPGPMIRERLVSRDGTVRTVTGAFAPIRDGSGLLQGFVVVLREQEVTDGSRLGSRFLTGLSHELRSPLNAIIGFAELLLDGVVEESSDDHRECLVDILTSGKRLLQVMTDLTELAKVDAGVAELYPEPASLPAFVGEVCEAVQAAASAKRVRVASETDPSLVDILTDGEKLKQVLHGYLMSAIHLTSSGGSVVVRARPEGASAFRVEVESSDADAVLERLLLDFPNADPAITKKHAATALRLGLARRLIEMQGGSVGVLAATGRGRVLHAVLPRYLAARRSTP